MFSKSIICMLNLFSACGFHPEFNNRPSTKQQLISWLIFLFHIALAICLTLYNIKYFIWLGSKSSKLQTFSGLTEYFYATVTYWIILGESFVQRKNQQKLWKTFHEIDELFTKRNTQKYQMYFIKFIENIALYIITLMLIWMESILSFDTFCAITLLLTLCRFRLFFYLFYLELIKCELKTMEYKAGNILLRKGCRRNGVKYIRQYYQLVYQLNDCINAIFGWSNLLSLLFGMCFIFTDITWLYFYSLRRSIYYQSGI